MIAPTVALVALVGSVIRHFLFSPKTKELVDEAYRKGQSGGAKPKV